MTTVYGNPSSTHTKGREAKKVLDESRKTIASALDCNPGELFFTSCGSESDNWAILNGARSRKRSGNHIISSELEHDAVRKSLDILESEGFEVTRLKEVTPDSVRNALRDDTVLVSLMMVNNETGIMTDIAGIRKILPKEVLLHTDAVQAFLKVPFSAKKLGADMISISGHKVHAPKGIGALYIKSGTKIKNFIVGGSQESGMRAGTEALPNIAAFAAAVKAYDGNIMPVKEYLIERLGDTYFIPSDAPHILNISLPGYRSEVLMNFLESREIYVSKSSACKQGKRSHVLEAMGLPADVIDGALRIGLSRFTTKAEIDAFVEALDEARNTLAHR